MVKVVYHFKSYHRIFLFEFLELWNLAFGPNYSWIRFGIYIEFLIPQAHLSASPSSSLSCTAAASRHCACRLTHHWCRSRMSIKDRIGWVLMSKY
jgi:hypothetical protein